MTTEQVFEELSDKERIKNFIDKIYPHLIGDEYSNGWNAALEAVMEYINNM